MSAEVRAEDVWADMPPACPDCESRTGHYPTCPRFDAYIASKADATTGAETEIAPPMAPVGTSTPMADLDDVELVDLAEDAGYDQGDAVDDPRTPEQIAAGAAELEALDVDSDRPDGGDGDKIPVLAGQLVQRSLDQVAADIRTAWTETKDHQVAAWDGYFLVGGLLLEARTWLPGDREFGRWVASQGFAFSQPWAWKMMEAKRQEASLPITADKGVSI